MADDELTFTVGAREIYDSVQALRAELGALRHDHAAEATDRATKDERTDRRLTAVERAVWQARGALGLATVAVGWLIESKIVGK